MREARGRVPDRSLSAMAEWALVYTGLNLTPAEKLRQNTAEFVPFYLFVFQIERFTE